MQIFIPLRLFALQGRHLSKVCSLGKSSEFCSLTFLIGKSFCLPFPWRKSGTNFCYCLRQFVITRQAACLRQEETLPQGPISGNFSPMIIGLNGSIFTPECRLLIQGEGTYEKKLDTKTFPFSGSNRRTQRCKDAMVGKIIWASCSRLSQIKDSHISYW